MKKVKPLFGYIQKLFEVLYEDKYDNLIVKYSNNSIIKESTYIQIVNEV